MNADIVYESDYDAHVHFGLPACHRVRITMRHVLPLPAGVEPPAEIPLHPLGAHEWSIQFDPNLCVLDDFGEVESSTLMYVWPWKMTLTFVKDVQGKALYDVDLTGESPASTQAPVAYTGLPFRLVTFGATATGHPERLRMLVNNKQGNVVQMIELAKQKPRAGAQDDNDE